MFFCQRASQSVLVPGSANGFAFPPGAPEARPSRMLLAVEATAMVLTETPLKNSRRFIDGLRLYFECARRQHLSPRGGLVEASLPKHHFFRWDSTPAENESVRVAEYPHDVGRKLAEYLYVLDALAFPSNARNFHRGYGERQADR